ncbi:MAG: contact-dependent growth inhibition system immunity protein [Verrucomicrobiota bacterium]
MKFDRSKSLQEIDGQDWGEPTFDSPLVTECHRLHRVPLCDFTAGNLRIMIGQDIGLEFLIPLALECLQEDSLIKGDYYECDLLVNVLRAKAQFWRDHPDLKKQVAAVTDRAISLFPNNPDIVYAVTVESVTSAYQVFKRKSREGS